MRWSCFLLVLSLDENLRRIRLRQSARALDEQEFEQRTVMEEREVLFKAEDDNLGELFDVSAPPEELVETLLRRLDAMKLRDMPPNEIACSRRREDRR